MAWETKHIMIKYNLLICRTYRIWLIFCTEKHSHAKIFLWSYTDTKTKFRKLFLCCTHYLFISIFMASIHHPKKKEIKNKRRGALITTRNRNTNKKKRIYVPLSVMRMMTKRTVKIVFPFYIVSICIHTLFWIQQCTRKNTEQTRERKKNQNENGTKIISRITIENKIGHVGFFDSFYIHSVNDLNMFRHMTRVFFCCCCRHVIFFCLSVESVRVCVFFSIADVVLLCTSALRVSWFIWNSWPKDQHHFSCSALNQLNIENRWRRKN